jgi:hypothetical protein
MRTQVQLLGRHPGAGPFAVWLSATDPVPTATQCYRALAPLQACDLDWIARRLVHYHYEETRIERLKAMYQSLGYPAYAAQHWKLPTADRTKKGNFGEVLLSDYIEACKGQTFIKICKLRYNPNIDQAMKGDDVLMVNLFQDDKGQDQAEIYLGETKFRATPTKTVVDELMNSLSKDKLPLSFSYLVDELDKAPANKPLVNTLDKLLMEEIHGRGGITYYGLLMGGARAAEMLQTHMNTDNQKLLLIAISGDDLETLIDQGFIEASRFITDHIDQL